MDSRQTKQSIAALDFVLGHVHKAARKATWSGVSRKTYKLGGQMSTAGVCVLLASHAPLALSQDAVVGNAPAAVPSKNSATADLGEIVVIGLRASSASAQQIKRDKIEITDSVVADDISKLPDINVAEAIQRVTGVQIQRTLGEGSVVAIRGLSQVETTLNGREVFTAGTGRTLNYADIPSEMLSGIDVYKTSSAGQIEGGVGGLVDLRTHRPFDFKGLEISGSARQVYSSLANQSKSQFSALLSDRWKTESHGEFGALANFAYQERAYREDQKGTGSPIARTNIIPGQTIIAPNGTTEATSVGQRNRTSANLILQWRPTDVLELYAEGNYSELKTTQNTYEISVSAPSTFVAGSPVLFPGTNDLQSIAWANASATTIGAARDTLDRTTQLAVGGKWKDSALTLKTDLSYTKSHNDLIYSAGTLNGTAATLTQNLSGNVPSSSVGGAGLTNLAGFSSAGIWYASAPFDGDMKAATLDGEYQLSGSVFDTLSAGLRYAQRDATDAPGQVGFFPATVPAANASSLAINNPYSNFFPGAGGIGNYLVVNPSSARNVGGMCGTLGIACAIPASNPLGTWTIAEETQSAYLMGKFKPMTVPLDGNLGLRAVRTLESVTGNQTDPNNTGNIIPIDIAKTYTDLLPSMNLRYDLGKGLYLRAAASKTVTRQDFSQISPSLTLNPVQLVGSAGNPELQPVRSNNLDVAVEKYINKTTSVYLTGFLKKVDGFLMTMVNPETYAGTTYMVSRPQNTAPADIKGFEVGYQQFYDFLPGWLRGLGMQANYTYVDSYTPNIISGQNLPLQNLSKNSYNLIGMYEKENVSARIAYNWRDKFVSGVANYPGLGTLPIYTKAYGWLDASMSYRLNKQFSVSIEGQNLLKTVQSSYYGVETSPANSFIDDAQLSVTLRAKL